MKKPELGQTIQILANVGVIAGIALLVYELNQNRDMMRTQIRNEISRSVMDLLVSGSTSEPLAAVMARANAGEDLSAEERFMFSNRAELSFRSWENVNYQYRQGMFDAAEYAAELATMSDVISRNPAMIRYWCERQMFSVPFAQVIDTLPVMHGCDTGR